MRTLLLICAGILIATSTANADLNKRQLWIALGAFPAAFYHETIYHEGSHALVALGAVQGLRITNFRVYPKLNGSSLTFGSVDMESPKGAMTDGKLMLIKAAPYITDTAAFITTDILLSTVIDPKKPSAPIVWMMGMVAPFLQFTMNYIAGSDWKGIREQPGHLTLDVVGGLVLAYQAYRTIHHGIRILRN